MELLRKKDLTMRMLDLKKQLPLLYGKNRDELIYQETRYQKLDQAFRKQFNEEPEHWFSTPGRTELGGNHTDHNHGRVLAASVHLDAIAAVNPSDDQQVTLFSEGYDQPFVIDLNNLNKVEDEVGTTSALLRGIAFRMRELGYRIGGFKACVASNVMPGSGLSSSATIEVLIGTIFNHLYNNGQIAAEEVAKIGQFAENVYFDKPCGLMDQMACATGGIIYIDFKEPQRPTFQKIDFDFERYDYRLLVVNTGGSHADLTADYASIPHEMRQVASALGQKVCREVDEDTFFRALPQLRKKVGDRAVLRAFHFIRENQRVLEQVKALHDKDFDLFLKLMNESGNSSFKWLQNIFTSQQINEQNLTLALALTEDYLAKVGRGACRVHGGGFAGTIQALLPVQALDDYIDKMEYVFGKNSVSLLKIRSIGTQYLNLLME